MALFIIFIYYVLVLSPVFRVEVRVVGLQRIPQETFLANVKSANFHRALSSFLGMDNYFSWPAELSVPNPAIRSVSVDKRWLEKKIILTVDERKPHGIWCFAGDEACFWIDREGFVFEPAPATEGNLLLRISSDAPYGPPYIGRYAVAREWHERITAILDFWNGHRIYTNNYRVRYDLHEFRADTREGAELRLSLRFDPVPSLAALASLHEKGELSGAEYVDLTVENRMYIKSR